jgi:NADH:ubiquinone oxidoreductase subunit 6 (subunit J)
MIFILLNVDFLGLLFLMVYVGAIAVLFLFIVMMLNIKKIERDQTVYLTIGGFFLFFYFFQIFFLIFYHSLVYLPEFFFFDSEFYSFSSINFLDESVRFFLIKKLGFLLYGEYFYFL